MAARPLSLESSHDPLFTATNSYATSTVYDYTSIDESKSDNSASTVSKLNDKGEAPNDADQYLHHRISTTGSVQALVVDEDILFAGLQGGDLVAWSLDTFERLARRKAHQESVLGLDLSEDKSLLFSCGADSVIKVWETQSLDLVYTLHSPFEVGDVFCVAFSKSLQTVFAGSQNSSIQWFHLSSSISPVLSNEAHSGDPRRHRFFDSLGPGGQPDSNTTDGHEGVSLHRGRDVTISESCYQAYAHSSYIQSIILAKGLVEDKPLNEVLISADAGGVIKVWSISQLEESGLKLLFKLKNKSSSIFSLQYQAPFLYAGLSQGAANVYNLSSQQLIQKIAVCSNAEIADISQIKTIQSKLFCCASNGLVKQINNKFVKERSWRAHNGKILASACSRYKKRRLLVTGGNDNTIAFWYVNDKQSSGSARSGRDDELLLHLRKFVAFRTVPRNSACVSDCNEAADFLRKHFNAAGAHTSLIPTGKDVNPIVLAKFAANSTAARRPKTLLFYGHYDVVDAVQEAIEDGSRWLNDPFTLYPSNGYLYGRGVSDDKGPILAALYAVAELVQANELACNVVFLIEGDEEAGSRGFRQAVLENKSEIGQVDYVLLSNSYWLDDHIPCLTFGMRGVVHASIEVTSSKPNLHSGMSGKAASHEPLKDLTVLVASLIGHTGTQVSIPRFYDHVDPLQQSEHRAYKSIATALMSGHPEIKDEDVFTKSLMQRWREPNLTVHSITTPETKTAVTISSRAKATISIRIVPSQTADRIASDLKAYLEKIFAGLGSKNTLAVNITAKADPWLGKVQSEIYEELHSAIVEAWTFDNSSRHFTVDTNNPSAPDVATLPSPRPQPRTRRTSVLTPAGTFTAASTPHEPLFIREGGSIPAISFLEKEFDAPAAMFPMGQSSDNAHLDNERIRVENLYKGKEILKMLFSRLGTRESQSLRHRASTVTI